MTIHKRPGSRTWYYWVFIIVAIAFVIAYYLSDGFGYGT